MARAGRFTALVAYVPACVILACYASIQLNPVLTVSPLHDHTMLSGHNLARVVQNSAD